MHSKVPSRVGRISMENLRGGRGWWNCGQVVASDGTTPGLMRRIYIALHPGRYNRPDIRGLDRLSVDRCAPSTSRREAVLGRRSTGRAMFRFPASLLDLVRLSVGDNWVIHPS